MINRVAAGRVDLVWTDATKQETAFILRRIPRLSWDEVEPLFRPEMRYAGELSVDAFGYIADPDDRKFAVLAASADVPLVTSDHHLLEHRGRPDLSILTPSGFLRQLQDFGSGAASSD